MLSAPGKVVSELSVSEDRARRTETPEPIALAFLLSDSRPAMLIGMQTQRED